MISIHALREEGDQKPGKARPRLANFYPRPPRGGRPGRGQGKLEGRPFLSTPSARRATGAETPLPTRAGFLSTPSARRATPGQPAPTAGLSISIHALREEGDKGTLKSGAGARISIHALREEGDPGTSASRFPQGDFYPRPPRGGRLTQIKALLFRKYFYPRPPRGGRRRGLAKYPLAGVISIHALREEGDNRSDMAQAATIQFLSTPSARRATAGQPCQDGRRAISIHALREEGDMALHSLLQRSWNFYPRPPRGGRQRHNITLGALVNFYPRPPRGGRRMKFFASSRSN